MSCGAATSWWRRRRAAANHSTRDLFYLLEKLPPRYVVPVGPADSAVIISITCFGQRSLGVSVHVAAASVGAPNPDSISPAHFAAGARQSGGAWNLRRNVPLGSVPWSGEDVTPAFAVPECRSRDSRERRRGLAQWQLLPQRLTIELGSKIERPVIRSVADFWTSRVASTRQSTGY